MRRKHLTLLLVLSVLLTQTRPALAQTPAANGLFFAVGLPIILVAGMKD